MKNYCLLFTAVLLLFACNEQKQEIPENIDKKPSNETMQTLEIRAKRHVESALTIPPTEEYEIEIWRENMDIDNKMDAIITVNRLEYAMDEAAKATNSVQRASIGFMGNHNYIFYYDGGLDKISPQIAIPSSPKKKLNVTFEHITSNKYKDVLIDYRVLNASYKAFYTVKNHLPNRIFEWKNFDGLTESKSEAYVFRFEQGSMSEAKDILIYQALLEQTKKEIDAYIYEPKIKPTNNLVYRFFYHPQTDKYMTKK